jgi:hypothetical protein
MFSGATALVDTNGYMLTALYNSMLLTGAGRHSEAVGFWFGGLDETLTSYRCVIDQNNIDTVETYKDDSDIPLTQTRYPGHAQEVQTTNALSTLTTNVATNATAITGKQATLSFSTVDADHATNPVTSANIKTYVDNAGGGDVYLANVNTFTANQEIKKNGNVKLTLEHTGYATPLEIGNNYGDAGITYVGKSSIKFNGNRIALEGGCKLLKLPVVSTKDTSNAAHGCIVVDDSGGASNLKLYFNTGGAWVNIT